MQSLKSTSESKLQALAKFSLYAWLIRPILFRLDAELAHELALGFGRLIQAIGPLRELLALILGSHSSRQSRLRSHTKLPDLRVQCCGLEFSNPIGLAAGFDKNAVLCPLIQTMGFGFVEIGTVTPRPQLGNPRPRLSRLPERRAILNRMGFNNDGIDAVAINLEAARPKLKFPVGVNLGKNRDTPNSEAGKDYERLFRAFHPVADYFAINISSPNTPGLRDLQSETFIEDLGARVVALRSAIGLTQPILVKLAPDIDPEVLRAIGARCGRGQPFAGLILTNTLPTDLGGLSGAPLKHRALETLKTARSLLTPDVAIVSVGGIETAEDVFERLQAGANAVQLYTAMVYQGPRIAARLTHDLGHLLRKRGIQSLNDIRAH